MKGRDVNRPTVNGETSLFYAQTPEIVNLLVQHGADLGARDYRGWMAHHYHTHYGQLAVFEKLTDIGADMHALTTEGYDVSVIAIAAGESEICELLLRAKFPSKVCAQPPWPHLTLDVES